MKTVTDSNFFLYKVTDFGLNQTIFRPYSARRAAVVVADGPAVVDHDRKTVVYLIFVMNLIYYCF